jgi:peptidoglycan-associated lipoprotein
MNCERIGKRPAMRAVWVIGLIVCLGVASGCGGKDGDAELNDDLLGAGSSVSDDELARQSSMAQFESTGQVASAGRFEDVTFGYDSSTLDSESLAITRRNAEVLRGDSSASVEIEGHCDERGTSEYNLALGARRAKSIRDGLVGSGISAERISTVSYGEELPVCKDAAETCYRRNRRGHMVDLTTR